MPADAPASPPSPLATPASWNLVADAYTAELTPQFELYARDALSQAQLRPSMMVVDVATGPGTVALMAAAAGCEVSAIDFSPAMVANLERRAAAAGLTVDVRIGDGQALPFASDRFDAAFSMFGLMFFPDRPAGFRELRRVLKPGGRAFVSSWAPFDGAFAVMMDAIRGMLPGLPFAAGKAPLGDPDEMIAEMQGAGFADAHVRPMVHDLKAESVDAFWQSVQRTTAPVVLLANKLGPEKWAEVAAGVGARLASELGPGPVTARGRAHLGIGTK